MIKKSKNKRKLLYGVQGLHTGKGFKRKKDDVCQLIRKRRFEIMKIRLSSRDIELICFIGRYKQIKWIDCKNIYKSKDYYQKRLKDQKKKDVKKRKQVLYKS